ncbi:MAG TPA: type I glutamate--ammonia ligase, partial [Clostridiales bacterium]|nr:type I glutamate--ammonia ligase [Clostridiales bacterium]
PEGEFFLFDLDDQGNPVHDTHDEAGYFDSSPYDRGEKVRREIVLALKKLGFSIEASHHEVAPGQHEVDFKYEEALSIADKWTTFKQIVKSIAHTRGLYASFLPKPFAGENGNAMHCNQSLMRDGKNAFYSSEDETGLSQTAKYYIGGLIKHAKSMAAICNPTVNSYKRLVPGYEAPTNIAWSGSNRSAFIRIPHSRGSRTRIELRTPDPTANPYLVFAVMLRAGLDGINHRIDPPKRIKRNIFEMSEAERKADQIEQYPENLGEALEHMEGDPFIRNVLGEHAWHQFLSIKKQEWRDFNTHVHPWEISRYLKYY